MPYTHILLATDLGAGVYRVAERARELARHDHAQVTLLHVAEPLGITDSGEVVHALPGRTSHDDTAERAAHDIVARAHDALTALARQAGLEGAAQEVIVSRATRTAILDTARARAVDLIVVGSHGRHGLALLLGSTANAVLHGAPCDVLAVRLPS